MKSLKKYAPILSALGLAVSIIFASSAQAATVPDVVGKVYFQGVKTLTDAGLVAVHVGDGPVENEKYYQMDSCTVSRRLAVTSESSPLVGTDVAQGTKVELATKFEEQQILGILLPDGHIRDLTPDERLVC